jgi:hypothetical protein
LGHFRRFNHVHDESASPSIATKLAHSKNTILKQEQSCGLVRAMQRGRDGKIDLRRRRNAGVKVVASVGN